jgi:hypothetical protein
MSPARTSKIGCEIYFAEMNDRAPDWNCVDSAIPSCYFSTAEKFLC